MNFLIVIAIASTICTKCYVVANTQPIERIYNYEAIVHVGTDEPAHFASTFRINGKLHYQNITEQSTICFLTDIVYNLNNGRIVDDHILPNGMADGHYLPIPMEVQSLTKPFEIIWHSSNHLKFHKLVVDETDREFSVNIKKAIVFILQMHSEPEQVQTVTEQTVYGNCKVEHHVTPKSAGAFILTKTFKLEDCESNFQLYKNWDFMTYVNKRVYETEIDKDTAQQRLTKITADGYIVTYPQGISNGVRYVRVHQRFTLIDEKLPKKIVTIEKKKILNSLQYTLPGAKCRDLPLNILIDTTNERKMRANGNEIVSKIYNLLTILNDYMKENHVNFERPATKNVRLITQLISLLEDTPFDLLQQCFNFIHEKCIENSEENNKLVLFVQLLSHTGTTPSTILIRNLIRKQKIDTNLAVMVLKNLPIHLKCPNEKLLTELEDLLTLHADDYSLHRACILAYASLIRKTFEKYNEQSPTLEKHINYFVDQLKRKPEKKLAILYLQALSNIQIGTVFTHLRQIVTDETSSEEYIRILALQAIEPHLRENPSLIFNITMPILLNRDLSTALRATAYTFYINAQPSYDNFMKLYQLFKDETNERFYIFHYNTLKSLSQLNRSKLANFAKLLLKFSRRPVNDRLVDGIYYNEYYDSKNDFSVQMRNILIDNEYEIIFNSHIQTGFNNRNYELFNLHFRIERKNPGRNVFGMAEPVSAEIRQTSPLLAVKMTFDLVIGQNGRTIVTESVDTLTFDVIRNILNNFNILHRKELSFRPVINFPFKFERIIATDMGVPLYILEQLPIIQSLQTHQNSNNLDLRLTILANHNFELKVYNPIEDLYHGITSVKSIAIDLPITLLLLNENFIENSVLQLYFMRNKNRQIGLQTYAETQVYIEGIQNKELLDRFNKNASVYETVIGNGEYKKKIPISNVTLPGIAKRMESVIFNCERDMSPSNLQNHLLTPIKILMPNDDNTNCGFAIKFHELLNDNDYANFTWVLKYADLHDIFTTDYYVNQSSLNTRIDFTIKSTYGDELVKQTMAIETTLFLDEHERTANASAHLAYVRNENDVESKIFVHIEHEQIGNRYNTNLKFDVDEEIAVAEMNIETRMSDEQQRMTRTQKFIYPECRRQVYQHQILLPYAQDCVCAASSLNQYTIDVVINNENNRLARWIDQYINFDCEKHYRVDFVFPVFRDDVDVRIFADNQTIETYHGISSNLDYMIRTFLRPYSSLWLLYTVRWGTNVLFNYRNCFINAKYILTDKYKILPASITTEYTTVLSAIRKFMIFEYEAYTLLVKIADDTGSLHLKIVQGNRTIEVQTINMNYVVNGKIFTFNYGLQMLEEKFYVIVSSHPKLLTIGSKDYYFTLIFDGKTVRIDVPYLAVDRLEGICME